MSRPVAPRKYVGFKLDAPVYAALEKQAASEDRTLSSLLRVILAEYTTAPAKKANGLHHKEHAPAP